MAMAVVAVQVSVGYDKQLSVYRVTVTVSESLPVGVRLATEPLEDLPVGEVPVKTVVVETETETEGEVEVIVIIADGVDEIS